MRRLVAALAAGVLGCSSPAPTYVWNLPEGIPPPPVPADNPMTVAKVELGRRLFFDERLSGNGTQSCGSCHLQARGFTDGRPVSVGSTGEHTTRNSMSITNVAYVPALTWANPALTTLEQQALVPLFGERPVELGATGNQETILARLRADASLVAAFSAAFPDDPEALTISNVVKAIACYERSLVSFDSPYDRYFYGGDESAMSASALHGMELFFGERLECFHCHGGYTFTDSSTHAASMGEGRFHNTGLYNVDGRGAYPEGHRGLYEHTGEARDMGRFRAPTLRNITHTAPYMHDGSIATLDEVIDHYAAGGRTIPSGPNAGVGSESPYRSIFVHGFTLSASERADLIAFLESLTDPRFVTDPAIGDPGS